MHKRSFRSLLIFAVVCSLLSFALALLGLDTAALELSTQLSKQNSSAAADMGGLLAIASLACFYLGSVGLFYFKAWGRWLFVLSFIISLPSYFLLGITILSPLSQLLYDLSCYACGAIFIVIYYTKLSDNFSA